MTRNQDWEDVKGLLDSLEIIKKVHERSDDFQKGRELYEGLNKAKIPEPALKPQGGPNYKTHNYSGQKKEVLLQIRDKHQQHNRELAKLIKKEVEACGIDKESLKKLDLKKMLDERIEERNLDSANKIHTDREVNKFLRQRGINPEQTREKNKPLDKNSKEKIPPADKKPEKSKVQEIDKVKEWQKTKKDMDIER